MNEAIRKATMAVIRESGKTFTTVANEIGMKQSEFSRRMHSDSFFPITAFANICTSVGVTMDDVYKRAAGTTGGAA